MRTRQGEWLHIWSLSYAAAMAAYPHPGGMVDVLMDTGQANSTSLASCFMHLCSSTDRGMT